MPGHGRISPWGAIPAALYVITATWFILDDRRHSSGGFINLSGMGTWLATLPVSLPLEWLGVKLNPRDNLGVAAALLICTLLVYGLGYLAEFVVRGALRRM